MTCEEVRQDTLPLRFDGLSSERAEAVAEHLADCQNCASLLASVDSALRLLRRPTVKAPVTAWEALKGRIEADVAKEAAAPKLKISVSCCFCKGGLERSEALFCGSCLAPYHGDCFAEYGRCVNLGCEETRTVKPLELVERRGAEPARTTLAIGKPKSPAPRPRGLIVAFATAVTVGVGVGVAALRPDRAERIPAPNPVDFSTPALPTLSITNRPILRPPGSAPLYRLSVDGVSFDRDGEPWFYVYRENHRSKILIANRNERPLDPGGAANSIASAIKEKQAGRGAYLLVGAQLIEQEPSGRLVFALEGAPNETLACQDGHLSIIRQATRPLVEVKSSPYPWLKFRSGIAIAKGEELVAAAAESFLGVDRWGRVYTRFDKAIWVRDPWGDGMAHGELRPEIERDFPALLLGLSPNTRDLDRSLIAKASRFIHPRASLQPLRGGLFINGALLQKTGPGALRLVSGASAKVAKRLASNRLAIAAGYDPSLPAYGSGALVVDDQSCAWFLQGGMLHIAGEGFSFTTQSLGLVPGLPGNGSVGALRTILPNPEGAGVIGSLKLADRTRFVILHVVEKNSIRVEMTSATGIEGRRQIVLSPDRQVWLRSPTESPRLLSWQGENRDGLAAEGTALLATKGLVWVRTKAGLRTWDGHWERPLPAVIPDSASLAHDRARSVVLAWWAERSPAGTGNWELKIESLILEAPGARSGGASKSSFRRGARLRVSLPKGLSGASFSGAGQVAGGRLWLQLERTGRPFAVLLPPSAY